MQTVSNLVVDLIEGSIRRRTAEGVGASFFEALKPFGATAINARAYLSATGSVRDEQVFCRIAPQSFMPVYGDRKFYDFNPLPFEARRRPDTLRWSHASWSGPGAIWVRETMRDCGCPDGLIVPCHGPAGYVGLMSIAFDRLDQIAPGEQAAIELASHALHGRMQRLAAPKAQAGPGLTPRERDCLLFVSEGQSDPAIAALMGISRATVAFHINNARRKLRAKTRAQAVATFVVAQLS